MSTLIFVAGMFILIGSIWIGFKPQSVPVEQSAPVVETDPFEVEIEWSPTVRKGYLLNHIPNV